MSRTMFIFGCALVAVAGSLIFVLNQRDEPGTPTANAIAASGRVRAAGGPPHEGFRVPAPRSSRRDETSRQAEVAIEPWRLARLAPEDREQADGLVARVARESRDRLDRLDATHSLTPAQRAAIHPLVVAHHPLAHPALQVAGQPIPSVADGASLEESIFPYLDEDQKQQLADAAIDQVNWWSEIIGQIEDDLDRALDQGVPAADGFTAETDGGVGFDTGGAAPGDGEASSHSGGNLFDLLGR